MPWSRYRVGRVNHQGLVHALYEWSKFERLFWETQCGVVWADRNNTNVKLKPPRTNASALTCFKCVCREL